MRDLGLGSMAREVRRTPKKRETKESKRFRLYSVHKFWLSVLEAGILKFLNSAYRITNPNLFKSGFLEGHHSSLV